MNTIYDPLSLPSTHWSLDGPNYSTIVLPAVGWRVDMQAFRQGSIGALFSPALAHTRPIRLRMLGHFDNSFHNPTYPTTNDMNSLTLFCSAIAASLLVASAAGSTSSVIGVRVLLDEGRRSGLGNPCSEQERELIKRAFRLATAVENNQKMLIQTKKQPLSCSHLCEDFDSGNCYLAHPKCSAQRRDDEQDHHTEDNYPDRMSIERFESDHIVQTELCDTALHATDDLRVCDQQKRQIKETMQNYLVEHLSTTCRALLHRKTALTCFRL